MHSEILSRYLPQEKYQTLLLGGALDPDERCKFDEFRAKGLRIEIVDEMRRELNPWQDLKAILHVARIIKREKPDIVCTHTAKAGTIGRMAGLLCRVPVIVHTFHGHVFEQYFGALKTAFFLRIERFLARVTDQIIAISPSQRLDLVEKYRIAAPDKVTMIRLGFELNRFFRLEKSTRLKHSLGIPEDHVLIAIIGRIVPIKNLPMMLRVMQRVAQKRPDIHLCVVGGGEEQKQLEILTKELQIDTRVHFVGWIEEIEHIYQGIDLLALTSLNEGTPVTLIEAMASRIPVIATQVGGVNDLLCDGENGVLCPSNDAGTMADRLLAMLEDSEGSRRRVANAFELVKNHYHYSRLVNEIDALYTCLLKKHGIIE